MAEDLHGLLRSQVQVAFEESCVVERRRGAPRLCWGPWAGGQRMAGAEEEEGVLPQPPTVEETCSVIKKLKRKAPGPDEIPTELLKK